MASRNVRTTWFLVALVCVAALCANAQSFRVQCPTGTITHPTALASNNVEPPYTGPTVFGTGPNGYPVPTSKVNGAIKCQQISGGDGYATMADGAQIYMFSFGPLSGLYDIARGLPGSEFPSVFNTCIRVRRRSPGDPATTDRTRPFGLGGASINLGAFTFNGSVGLVPDVYTDPVSGNPVSVIDGAIPPPGWRIATTSPGNRARWAARRIGTASSAPSRRRRSCSPTTLKRATLRRPDTA